MAIQFGITLVVFFLIRLVPGDAVDFIFGQNMSPERMNEIRRLWGLDRPAVVQYVDWLSNVLRGDFGHSILSGRPIVADVGARLPVTLEISVAAALWSILLGVTLGIVAARYAYTKIDGVITTLTLAGLATPSFWLATLLVMFFAVRFHVLPAVGFVPFTEDPLANLRSIVLPALALGTTMAAAVMRMTRSGMLEVLSHDYIRTARAKGVSEAGVLSRHAPKNALIPVLTVIGTETGKLLGGSLIIEQIFAIPGIGQYAVSSIFSRDYPVLQASVLVVASCYVMVNTLVDMSYSVIDPRIRYT